MGVQMEYQRCGLGAMWVAARKSLETTVLRDPNNSHLARIEPEKFINLNESQLSKDSDFVNKCNQNSFNIFLLNIYKHKK